MTLLTKTSISKTKDNYSAMARKVLISFLGTGPKGNVQKGPKHENREYNFARYHFEDGAEFNTSFVADALVSKYGIDDTILLGTTHSMWERVYEVFSQKAGVSIDEDYYYDLAEHCDKADSKSDLVIPHPEKVETLLGKDSHIVLLRYGMNNKEIRENISIVLSLEKYLLDGDDLTIDITHSFRSLPLYIMNLLLYLKNVSSKKIKISRICYGMLDASSEFTYTPVISLNGIMDVQDWITGAYNFQEFGNAYKIAGLLETDSSGNYSIAAKQLRRFADAKNLNQFREFRTGIKDLKPLMDSQNLPDIAKLLVPTIIEKFANRFPASLTEYIYQYRMAEWHANHFNYGYALIDLVESALSYCCEIVPDSYVPEEFIINGAVRKREAIRTALNYIKKDRGKESVEKLRSDLGYLMKRNGVQFRIFNDFYDKVNGHRNTIAHDLEKSVKSSQMKADLEESLKYFRGVFQPSSK